METNPSLRRSATLAHTVEASLTRRIQQGVYKESERLPTEAALVEEFGVSRSVVREAVSRLQAAGLVASRQGKGTFVCEPANATAFRVDPATLQTLHDVVSVLEVRMAIETEAAGLAAERRTPDQLRSLHVALEGFASALAAGADTVEHDMALHHTIAAATHNPRFLALLSAMGRGAIPRARLQPEWSGWEPTATYLAHIHAEHQSIVAAIAAGDADAARCAMRQHLSQSRERRLEQARSRPYRR